MVRVTARDERNDLIFFSGKAQTFILRQNAITSTQRPSNHHPIISPELYEANDVLGSEQKCLESIRRRLERSVLAVAAVTLLSGKAQTFTLRQNAITSTQRPSNHHPIISPELYEANDVLGSEQKCLESIRRRLERSVLAVVADTLLGEGTDLQFAL